jgi:four helix bundle protein
MSLNNDFQELKIWQKAHDLTLKIYKLTEQITKSEEYGLKSQIRRSAVSVAANIAEGYGRKSKKDFTNFLIIARGSIQETRYHCILLKDLGLIPSEQLEIIRKEYESLKISINAFIKAIAKLK